MKRITANEDFIHPTGGYIVHKGDTAHVPDNFEQPVKITHEDKAAYGSKFQFDFDAAKEEE